MIAPCECVPTGSSWTLRRPKYCGLLPVIVLISCCSRHFELALTKLCQLLSFVTSAFTLTLTSRRGHTSRPSLPASPYCVSCEASADPFSSRWWRHSFWRGWITEMLPSPAFRCAVSFGDKLCCSLMFSSSKYEYITTLLRQLIWLKAAEYKLALLVYKWRQGRGSTVVPRRWTLPASRHRGSTSFAFCLVIVADCPPYTAVNRQWPSFSGRHLSYLERSSSARHVSTVTGRLPQSPEDSSLQALLPTSPLYCRVREVTSSLRTR